ncbi:MAG: SEC-C metal-binding domain-containing protein, partial [Pseudomonadota bacterium]
GLDLPVAEWAAEEGVANEEVHERISKAAADAYAAKRKAAGDKQVDHIEKQVLLQVLDLRWREHLQQIDQLRSVIHLRGYGQRNPLNEFKEEAFKLFHALLGDLRSTVTRSLMNLRVEAAPPPPPTPPTTFETHVDPDTGVNEVANPSGPVAEPAPNSRVAQAEADWSKTPRNAPCPCGSGKKFKHCHGALAGQV